MKVSYPLFESAMHFMKFDTCSFGALAIVTMDFHQQFHFATHDVIMHHACPTVCNIQIQRKMTYDMKL